MTHLVEHVDPRHDPSWLKLSAGPGGSLFTSPPWITAVCESYDFRPDAEVALDDDGRPVGGFAWVEIEDLRGRRRSALPFCDRADPIVGDLDTWRAVSAAVLNDGPPLTMRCLSASPVVEDSRLTTTGEAAWHQTLLGSSVEALYERLHPQVRRNIATAGRRDVEVMLSADRHALAEYHRLHVRLRKQKYGLLAQPAEFFDAIWRQFAPIDSLCTALAFVEGRPVAGAVYLVWQDIVYYKFGASLPDFLSTRPNDALHWHLMQWAISRGLYALDWGLSDLEQPGLVGYKQRWASIESRIYTLNAGGTPHGRSDDTEQMLRTMTRLFTDATVPDFVTAQAGAALYRYFC